MNQTADGFRHGFADVGGLRLHYAERGSGPLVLMLHGFPEFWYAWRHPLAVLGERFHAVACDTRGINRSDRPAAVDAYRLEALVGDVAGLVAALGHERATLVGHDWGGFMAWETAIRRPDLVDRLVIVNCQHPELFHDLCATSPEQQAASRYMLAFRSARGEELVARDDFAGLRANILEPGLAAGHLSQADAEAYLALWRDGGSVSAGLNYYRANRTGPAGAEPPQRRPLAETVVRVPTLVIWGERDPYFAPSGLDRLPEVATDLTLRRFPDNDHWIIHQRPDEVARLVAAFAGGEAV